MKIASITIDKVTLEAWYYADAQAWEIVAKFPDVEVAGDSNRVIIARERDETFERAGNYFAAADKLAIELSACDIGTIQPGELLAALERKVETFRVNLIASTKRA